MMDLSCGSKSIIDSNLLGYSRYELEDEEDEETPVIVSHNTMRLLFLQDFIMIDNMIREEHIYV